MGRGYRRYADVTIRFVRVIVRDYETSRPCVQFGCDRDCQCYASPGTQCAQFDKTDFGCTPLPE
jgi:hypothetical protein